MEADLVVATAAVMVVAMAASEGRVYWAGGGDGSGWGDGVGGGLDGGLGGGLG